MTSSSAGDQDIQSRIGEEISNGVPITLERRVDAIKLPLSLSSSAMISSISSSIGRTTRRSREQCLQTMASSLIVSAAERTFHV